MVLEFNDNSTEIFKDLYAFFGVLSSDYSILTLSGKRFADMSVKPEMLVGQKFSDAVFWQTSDENINRLRRFLETPYSPVNNKIRLNFRINSKKRIRVELQIKPFASKKQIFFCAREITRPEIGAAESAKLSYAAEHAEIGLWFWDLETDQIYSNSCCKTLFDVPPGEEIRLDKIIESVHPDDRQRFENEILDSKKNELEQNTEFRIINSEGNQVWVSLTGKTALDKNGKAVSISGIARNITDRKLANEELTKLYAAEKKALDQAEEANRAKDFFIAFVSHELRSPLNAILGWTKILLTKKLNDEARINALETIERSARSQAKLINDLVDSARVASGKLRLEFRPVNLFTVLKNIYDSQKPNAEEKNIDLELSADNEDLRVFGDATRLQQVFVNLVSNALKFTPEGGKVLIGLNEGEENVRVFVRDNGQGISKDVLPRIFRQYSQGDESTSRDTTGLGLGLSIAKTLVEKHNGKIGVISEGMGKGATFTVTLPLISADVEQSAPQKFNKMEGEPLSGYRIMIVEDDPDSCEVLQLFLEQSGGEVICAESAKTAMKFLSNNNKLPHIIISDLGMPEIDGYALMEEIRRQPRIGKIPSIALSAFTTDENRRKAFISGFQKYHTKPFEPDLLISEIRQLTLGVDNNGKKL